MFFYRQETEQIEKGLANLNAESRDLWVKVIARHLSTRYWFIHRITNIVMDKIACHSCSMLGVILKCMCDCVEISVSWSHDKYYFLNVTSLTHIIFFVIERNILYSFWWQLLHRLGNLFFWIKRVQTNITNSNARYIQITLTQAKWLKWLKL